MPSPCVLAWAFALGMTKKVLTARSTISEKTTNMCNEIHLVCKMFESFPQYIFVSIGFQFAFFKTKGELQRDAPTSFQIVQTQHQTRSYTL